ncbi:unnamed protein product [Closterium sp. NIES-54]
MARLSFLATSLAVLILAMAGSAFARHYAGTATVTKPAAVAACTKSNLAPYTKSVQLTADGYVTVSINFFAASLRESFLSYHPSTKFLSLFLLHWNITKKNDGIIAAIEAKQGSGAETGWMSIGWTKKAGLMAPADAVVGNLAAAAPNNVLAYAMTAKTVSKVKKTTAVKLSARSVVTAADGVGKIVK